MIQLNNSLNDVIFDEKLISDFIDEFAFLHNIDDDLIKIYLYLFLGNSIADKIILNPTKDSNYYISPNLWGAIISPPGTKKVFF